MALLKERIAKGTFKNPALIERKIGILLKSHPRVARFYRLEIKEGLLAGTRNDASFEDQLDLCGNYILCTDQVLEPGQIWSLYMTLLQAEEGFACLKGSLGLRPNFHQLERRVDAHIFISVLAYHLLTWVREKLRAHGDTRDWKTIRRVLSTHSLVTTRLPLKDGRTLSLRKASLPDPSQTLIYHCLGIDPFSAFAPQKTYTSASAGPAS